MTHKHRCVDYQAKATALIVPPDISPTLFSNQSCALCGERSVVRKEFDEEEEENVSQTKEKNPNTHYDDDEYEGTLLLTCGHAACFRCAFEVDINQFMTVSEMKTTTTTTRCKVCQTTLTGSTILFSLTAIDQWIQNIRHVQNEIAWQSTVYTQTDQRLLCRRVLSIVYTLQKLVRIESSSSSLNEVVWKQLGKLYRHEAEIYLLQDWFNNCLDALGTSVKVEVEKAVVEYKHALDGSNYSMAEKLK